ncbi:MAG: hypothetical protein DWQ37_10220 [Planctomycetota bacterium]|nr:MAG: hypothetical protein DWQ37_10220 [Planctomycetota bacterium]
MNVSGLALLFTWVAFAPAEAPAAAAMPPKIARFLEQCETSRQGAIAQIKHQLRGLQDEAGDAAARRSIARLEKQLRVLEANESPVVAPLSFPPQSGAIGRLPGLSCHVEQVLSDREFLATCTFPVTITAVRNFKRYRDQVSQKVRFVVRGLPTQDLEPGADLQSLDVFEVSGRETYRTVSGGSQAVLVLTRFDLKQVEPYFRRRSSRR